MEMSAWLLAVCRLMQKTSKDKNMNTANLPCSGQPRIASMECKRKAMPWLSWLVDFWLSQWGTSFNPRPAHVEFVVDKVALGEVIL